METDLLTSKEAAERLGIAVVTLRQWRSKGLITAVLIGGKPMFRPADVDAVQRPHVGRPVVTGKWVRYREGRDARKAEAQAGKE